MEIGEHHTMSAYQFFADNSRRKVFLLLSDPLFHPVAGSAASLFNNIFRSVYPYSESFYSLLFLSFIIHGDKFRRKVNGNDRPKHR